MSFFETVLDPQVQGQWASLKSAIPVVDVDPEDIEDPIARDAQAKFKAATFAFTPNVRPSAWWGQRQSRRGASRARWDSTALSQYLLDNYALAGTSLAQP